MNGNLNARGKLLLQFSKREYQQRENQTILPKDFQESKPKTFPSSEVPTEAEQKSKPNHIDCHRSAEIHSEFFRH